MARKTAIMMVVISALLVGGAAQGSILIGTWSGNDNEALVTDAIQAYTGDVSLVASFVGKLEEADWAEGTNPALPGKFNFYQEGSGTDKSQSVFGKDLDFGLVDVETSGYDHNVYGFEYTEPGAVPFGWYVVKSALQWSLWMYCDPTDGFPLNPAYTASAENVSSGDSRDPYNPPQFGAIGNDVSHISFYTTGNGEIFEIPEPGSIVVWSLLGLVVVGGSRLASKRRNRN